MYNFSTGNEFSGRILGILLEAGYEPGHGFVTFKQAVKLPGLSGKKLKGIKKAASLVRFVKQVDKVTGKEEKKPRYYSVFDIEEVLQRR